MSERQHICRVCGARSGAKARWIPFLTDPIIATATLVSSRHPVMNILGLLHFIYERDRIILSRDTTFSFFIGYTIAIIKSKLWNWLHSLGETFDLNNPNGNFSKQPSSGGENFSIVGFRNYQGTG